VAHTLSTLLALLHDSPTAYLLHGFLPRRSVTVTVQVWRGPPDRASDSSFIFREVAAGRQDLSSAFGTASEILAASEVTKYRKSDEISWLDLRAVDPGLPDCQVSAEVRPLMGGLS
jgi:hypothetical protein